MLYLVATPIGNLGDITIRALEALKEADYILCEDTRRSSILLRHYEISRPLKSYHKFNEARHLDEIIKDLSTGKTLCLISDAGTPGISDPGERLVKRCHEENISVFTCPGACAAVAALSCSGQKSSPFTFYGFLPKKLGELKERLITILSTDSTAVFYLPPQQLIQVLSLIFLFDHDREVGVFRELTKAYEEIKVTSASKQLEYWKTQSIKGELVLTVTGDPLIPEKQWALLQPREHVNLLKEQFKLETKEALLLAAKLRGAPKRELYSEFHNLSDSI